ncbi:toprim domain-containing protein [Cellulophaga baltica 4]|nr:toprim domain-containing protein [Cellulophaga baltica 4]
MNCTEAKKIDIVMTLKELGFSPIKEINNEAWFLSPLRKETKPSFKVHKGKNLYFDFGQGQGGNLVDLLVKLIGSVEEALKYLSQNKNSFSFHQPPNNNAVIDNKTIIKKVIDIQHFGLIQYLEKRGILINIAREFCKEVHYSIGKSNYFGIGFQSNSQSWELRNKYFKSASSPKDITCISYRNSTVLIFEGFMDFLSHRVIFPNQTNSDFIICNSTALIKKLADKLEKYANVEIWLDNDNSGKKLQNILNLFIVT